MPRTLTQGATHMRTRIMVAGGMMGGMPFTPGATPAGDYYDANTVTSSHSLPDHDGSYFATRIGPKVFDILVCTYSDYYTDQKVYLPRLYPGWLNGLGGYFTYLDYRPSVVLPAAVPSSAIDTWSLATLDCYEPNTVTHTSAVPWKGRHALATWGPGSTGEGPICLPYYGNTLSTVLAPSVVL